MTIRLPQVPIMSGHERAGAAGNRRQATDNSRRPKVSPNTESE